MRNTVGQLGRITRAQLPHERVGLVNKQRWHDIARHLDRIMLGTGKQVCKRHGNGSSINQGD